MRSSSLLWILMLVATAARADGPQDNLAEKVRPVPPPGIAVPAEVRKDLQAGVEALGKRIEQLKTELKAKPDLLALLPDVQIYHRAVSEALKYDEFYDAKEFGYAKKLLQSGFSRAESLHDGESPWTKATGHVVRGYVSKIDGSVQPYGLVIPVLYRHASAPQRLDVWFHGRGEKLTELSFLVGRITSKETPAPNVIVLHPYGRYCNANHFAGEIDALEAIEDVKRHYPIDDNRILVRGFSMGGAACWNFAVHYAGDWAGAAPGAGFSESPDFLRVFQDEKVQPTWYERKLFHLYDCTDWCLNLLQCPTVAYSGEIDRQKQAADIMAKALAEEGIELEHLIGPKTAHAYHPATKVELNRRMDSIAAVGRPMLPRSIRFVTYTLRYNQMRWVTVDRMTQHWTRARIEADITGDREVKVKTQGVETFTLSMPAGTSPLDRTHRPNVIIDGASMTGPPVMSDLSWEARFTKAGSGWALAEPKATEGKLVKQHLLQGPIDDAFMDRFVMVRPTGTPMNDKVGKWVQGEMEHARVHWRRQFRGDAPFKDDTQIAAADIANSNLILWGDPSSNAILKKIADQLPIRWSSSGVQVGGKSLAADHHAVALIYPNPLNPKKYVVLNSGFTFREYDYLNNARQIPKLPDWVVFDVDQPPTSRRAAGIADAAFFGERWELTDERK